MEPHQPRKSTRSDVMIDLETLSTRPNACILTIGAIKFSKREKEIDTFHRRINVQSCLDIGMVQDPQTMEWWNTTASDVARADAFSTENRVDIREALIDFKAWLGDSSKLHVWSNGSCFDCVILDEAYYRLGVPVPWKYFHVRDTRTVYDLGDVTNKDMPEVEHTAMADCRRQILGLHLAFSKLSLKH